MMFDFANKWSGMMEQYEGFLASDFVVDEFVCSSFDVTLEYLKIPALYIWWKAKDQRAVND